LVGFVKVTRDLTERRQAEARLLEAESRAEAQRLAVKERDAFISVAAHELRTPLTALKLKLNTAERAFRRDPAKTDVLLERVSAAIAQTDRLSALVDRLLDVSRACSGELGIAVEVMDLAVHARTVTDDFSEESLASGTPITVEAQGDTRGLWDPGRLE